MIRVNNLIKKYGSNIILNNINCTFSNGLIGLVGTSGEGKTTLLNILSLNDDDYQGNIFFNGIEYKSIKEKEDFRKNNFGFVFQNPIMFDDLSVIDNICFDEKQDISNKNKVSMILEKVGLNVPLNKEAKYLSGGEKQRLSIARAIFHNVNVIFCDEPTGALDHHNKVLILKLLKELSKEKLIIIVTHEDIVKDFADSIYELKNGNLHCLIQKKSKEEVAISNNDKNKLSIKVMFNYIFKTIKAKKIRSFLAIFALGIGLFSVGISSLINDVTCKNVEYELMSSFSTKKYIIKQNNIVDNGFNEIYSLDKENTEKILLESDLFLYMGTYYLSNINNLIINNNYFELQTNNGNYSFAELNANSINEFNIYNGESVFPNSFDKILDDEIILGLRKKDIKRICQNLNLNGTDYLTLSNYLENNYLSFQYKASNEEWNYYINIDFKCRYFVITDDIKIYHTNYYWNEYVFEQKMHLSTTNDLLASSYLPWTIKKVYYLQIIGDERIKALKELMLNERYNDYHFDFICNYQNNYYEKNRIFITKQTNQRLNIAYLSQHFDDYFYSNNYTYYVNEKLLINGFINPTILSDDEEKIISFIDKFYISEENILSTYLEGDFVYGSMLNITDDNHLKFNVIDESKELIGRKNLSYQEIVVSKGIIKNIFNDDNYTNYLNKDLYFMSLVSSKKEKELYHNDFQYVKLKIVGIVNDDELTIYGDSLWPSLFYVDNFSFSPSDVEPINCVASKYYQLNDEYTIIDPFVEIQSDIDQVLYYVNLCLDVFTIISSLCAIMMNIVILYLFIEEKKKEIALMKILGIRKNDIQELFILFSFVIGALSFIYSMIVLIIVNVVISFDLTSSFYLFSNMTIIEIIKNTFILTFFISLIIGYVTSLYCTRIKALDVIKDK